MPLSRARGLAWLLVGGCAEATPCAAPDAMQRVAATGVGGDGLVTFWAGDHAYYVIRSADDPRVTWVGPRCEDAAHEVVRGPLFAPVRTRQDPLADDPTLACDQLTGHFFRVDPTGGEAPALIHPDKNCIGRWTEHGLVVRDNGHERNKLWLYRSFPAGATEIADGASTFRVVGDVVYTSIPQDGRIERYDLASRARATVAEGVADTWTATATHVLWSPDRASPSVFVRDVASGTTVTITHAELSDAEDKPDRHGWAEGWRFMPDGAHVVYLPPSADDPPQAFDTEGAPIRFPVPGDLRELHDERVALSRTQDGQWWATEIGDTAARALDLVDPSLIDPEADADDIQDSPFHDGRVEVVRAGELWAVPLDGGPRTVVAGDVGAAYTWIDADRLLTLVGDELQTVAVDPGDRRTHARDVVAYAVPGDLAAEGAHVLVQAGAEDPRTGVWWLPAAELGP